MLSRLAREFAAEIAAHDWSDAPYRLDRAGHRREHDTKVSGPAPLTQEETDRVRTNVMWVTLQVLRHADPNLKDHLLHEYAEACGVPRYITHNRNGQPSGAIEAGIRFDRSGNALPPGQWFGG